MFRGLIYAVVFLGGAMLGNLVPGYLDLYRQRLEARYEQVSIDLRPFQTIADRYHGGSLAALVQYHLASDDPTFHDEGVALRAMLDSRGELSAAIAAFDESLVGRARYVLRNADSEFARETWDVYRPAPAMTRDGLLASAAGGAAVCALCWLGWSVLGFGRR